jgi:hypothetical protein
MSLKFSLRTAIVAITVAALVFAFYGYVIRPPAQNIPVFGPDYSNWGFQVAGTEFETTIHKDAILKSPPWDRRRSHPPLSPNTALILADQLRMRWIKEGKIPEHVESDSRWEVRSIQLIPADVERWYWLVTFEQRWVNGAAHEFIVPVLMDGTVIEPKVRPEEPETSP